MIVESPLLKKLFGQFRLLIHYAMLRTNGWNNHVCTVDVVDAEFTNKQYFNERTYLNF